jgi:aerobic carbon-monoxide dehydrogenase medium subunit
VTRVLEPATVEQAAKLLDQLDGAAVLAGGTWVMRAGMRGESPAAAYVSLRRVKAMQAIARADGAVRIGAMVTHARIADLADDAGPLGALAEAARRSAFPAVRNVATLGGNLAAPFPQADLVPPLLAADAVVEVARPSGPEDVDLASWLREPGGLLTGVRVQEPPDRRSWFERVTVRAAAEYSIASVAVSAELSAGALRDVRVAVGAVEELPVRVAVAEGLLEGRAPDAAAGEEAGAAAAESLHAREALDAPGWYRLAVLAPLVRRAVERIGA